MSSVTNQLLFFLLVSILILISFKTNYSDEGKFCNSQYKTCSPQEFTCQNFKCIRSQYRCDGEDGKHFYIISILRHFFSQSTLNESTKFLPFLQIVAIEVMKWDVRRKRTVHVQRDNLLAIMANALTISWYATKLPIVPMNLMNHCTAMLTNAPKLKSINVDTNALIHSPATSVIVIKDTSKST